MTAGRLTLLAMLAGCVLVAAPTLSGHSPRFIWNASASVPIGLYRVAPVRRLDVGDLVVALPPDPLAAFLAERGYLARNVPLIKRVLALPGTTVCRRGTTIWAYDRAYGEARTRDSRGRDLPAWQGCRPLTDKEVFLMNWDAEDSFDGRYFGPLPATAVTARVIPLWTDPDGNGRFRWHAEDDPAAP